MLTRYIAPLSEKNRSQVMRLLMEQEPWNIVALDALQDSPLNQSNRYWYGEFHTGQLVGVLYYAHGLLHVAYRDLPSNESPVFRFIAIHFRDFIIHGNKKQVMVFKKRLHGRYRIRKLIENSYVTESNTTRRVVAQSFPKIHANDIHIGSATIHDESHIRQLFTNTEMAAEVDWQLLHSLLLKKRILVATRNERLIGTVMCLKQSPNYALLGGLYVSPTERRKGIATRLGVSIARKLMYEGKRICFYFSSHQHMRFYERLHCERIGTWVTYSFTSKRMT